jgi:predicted nuclease with TOPRIM domain
MEEIISYLKRKSQLIYDINCIKKYIEGGDYDNSLKNAWEMYKKELAEINGKIEKLKMPQLHEYEIKKQSIFNSIKEYEEKIRLLKTQLKELDKLIMKLSAN